MRCWKDATMGKAPNYLEAYPRLDVLQAAAAERGGRGTCVFTDESGRDLSKGHASPQKSFTRTF